MKDPEATDNDRFVAYDLLKNANIAAGGVLPMCQDTGTAIIMGKKGRRVWTEGGDADALGAGVLDAYNKKNLRYSQLAPLSMFEERTPRTICLRRSTSTKKVKTPTNSCLLPRAAVRLTRRSCFKERHRC